MVYPSAQLNLALARSVRVDFGIEVDMAVRLLAAGI